jgi:hypothetical protein
MCVFCDNLEHERIIKEEQRTLSQMHIVTRHKLYDNVVGTVYLKRANKASEVPYARTRDKS